ncbi:MAG: tetratricopeptide repeat protein [candidate division NC10 bacterium]|nr:tetratricopeptide repeat protein [candidate division NC10 bacterium]
MAFDKRKSLQNALAFTQQGKWDKAIAEYQAILRADPKDLTVCNNLGDLFARAGKLADAIDQYLRLGELYRVDGLAVKAIAVYKKIVKLDPARVAAYLACADLYLEQGLVGEAKIQLGTAADLFGKAGDTAELVKTYQRLTQLDPANVPLSTRLADLLLKLGRTEEAAVEYERAGQAAQAAGQAGEAKRLLHKARELAPHLAGPSLEEAEALLQSGKFAEAIGSLDRLTVSEPTNANAWRLLGEAHVGAGQGADGLAALRQAIAMGIGEEALLTPLAAAMVLADQGSEAVGICERVTEDALNRGEPDDAVNFCRGLLVPGAAVIPLRSYLTTLLLNLGRDEEARAEALELAAAHEAAGDTEDAARLYQQLVERNPGDVEARDRLEAVRPGGGTAPEPEGLTLSVGDDAAPTTGPSEVQAPVAAEPEITLEGIDDLAALLGEQHEAPAPTWELVSSLELEHQPGGSFGALEIEAAPDPSGGEPAGPSIELAPSEEESPLTLESLAPAVDAEPAAPPTEEPALVLESSAPEDQAGPAMELGEFSALLQEPSEDGVLNLDTADASADLLALLGPEPAAEAQAQEEEPSEGPPVIELPSEEEPIVFQPEQPEDAPTALVDLAAEIPGAGLLEAEAETPRDEAPSPASPWTGLLEEPETEEPPESAAATGPAVIEIVTSEDDGSRQVAEQMAEAEVYLKYGLEDKARERLVEAIRLAPAALSPRAKLKELCQERGQIAETCQQIVGMVELLLSASRQAEAVEELRQGLTLMPDHPEFRRYLESLGGASVLVPPGQAAPAESIGAAGEAPVGTGEQAPAAEREVLELEASLGSPDLEFLQVAGPVEDVEEVPPATETLELVSPTETVDLAETVVVAEAAETEPAESSREPAGATPDLTQTVAISVPPVAPPSLEAEAEAEAEAADRAMPLAQEECETLPPPIPALDGAPETVVLAVPEAPAEEAIPVQLQALLEGPEAGPILVVEDNRSEQEQLLADDLAEAEFYLAQGMLDEACAVHRRLQAQYPAHPAVSDLGGKLTPSASPSRQAAGPEGGRPPAPLTPAPAAPPRPAPAVSLQDVIPKFTVTDSRTSAGSGLPGGAFVDLGAELTEELAAEEQTTKAKREAGLVDGVLREFQRGVREQIGDADFETHYNLGVAYKDMELFDEAIEEFRLASRGVERAVECAELLGQCFLAKGQPEEAIRHLRAGLEVVGRPREAYHGLRYTLSLAYDTHGEVEQALEQLEVVQGEDPRFRDVAARAQLLRARLVKRPQATPQATRAPGAKSKKKISFI